ncbi:hypothetical protein KAR91_27080 [Candidatus Pacearchaeota archaeon]|nr:hypothetical protein [Candidatus Pacearchaeota archaeon]
MNDYLKIFIVALIASLVGGYMAITLTSVDENQGGITNYDQVDAADGFSVDETIVIDGTGNVDAPVTSTTGSFSTSLGVASTTPFGDFAVGTGGATSTISAGNFCLYAQDEAGTAVWIKIDLDSSNVFSTSTTACN